jgi:hypothetical protein
VLTVTSKETIGTPLLNVAKNSFTVFVSAIEKGNFFRNFGLRTRKGIIILS